MDEQNIRDLAKGVKNVEKRLDRDVAEMCTLLEALAEQIFENRPELPRQDAGLLRKHFHDIYKSLKLHLVFHSGADFSDYNARGKLEDLGRAIRLNDEELERQPDENLALEYCADPWSKLLEIVSTHFRMVYNIFLTYRFGGKLLV